MLQSYRIRQSQFNFACNPAPAEDDETFNIITDLLNQTWTIFGVSTLFGLQLEEVNLKQYAKCLREKVASLIKQEDVSYDAKISVMDNETARPSLMVALPLKVEVYIITSENVRKCIYNGIFLSWSGTQGEFEVENSTQLPLLLCRGSQNGIHAVHATLCRMFDCIIIPLWDKDVLSWLVPIIIISTSKNAGKISMEYAIPELPVTDAILIKFDIADLKEMLKVITKVEDFKEDVEISLEFEDIKKFYDVLHYQMLKTAGLQLGLCTLHRINSPALTIMGNRMKVMDIQIMNCVLQYLNERVLDMLHTLNFSISSS